MSISEIFNIVQGVLFLIVSFVSTVLSLKYKAKNAAEDAISKAEELKVSGAEKLGAAVEQVKAVLPKAVASLVPKKAVEQLVQLTFDKIKEFAEKRIKGE